MPIYWDVSGTAYVSFAFDAAVEAPTEKAARERVQEMIRDAQHDRLCPMDWSLCDLEIDMVERQE